MNQLVSLFRHQLHVTAHGFNEIGIARNSERKSDPVSGAFFLRHLNASIAEDFGPILMNKVTKHRPANSVDSLPLVLAEVRGLTADFMVGQKKLQQRLDRLKQKKIATHAAEYFVLDLFEVRAQ